jgi:thiol-disulfide isomerase/thioredoxin
MLRRATLVILVFFLSAVASAQETAGVAPPQLVLEDMNARKRSLEEYRGRMVVLNFWATWCVPCREEMPLLGRVHAEYAERGVAVVGASADDASTQENIAPFLRELKLTFPIWRGATTGDMERFGLGTALPATAILDRDGSIAFRILGPLGEAELRARLEWLLGGRAASAPEAVLNNFEKAHAEHEHAGAEDHAHGGVGLEGASTVPS